MNSNKKLKVKTNTLNSVLLQTLIFILFVNIVGGIIANLNIIYVISATIIFSVGMGVLTIIVYYLVNNKSFDPIDEVQVNILKLLILPFFLIIALGIYFWWDFIINLF